MPSHNLETVDQRLCVGQEQRTPQALHKRTDFISVRGSSRVRLMQKTMRIIVTSNLDEVV